MSMQSKSGSHSKRQILPPNWARSTFRSRMLCTGRDSGLMFSQLQE